MSENVVVKCTACGAQPNLLETLPANEAVNLARNVLAAVCPRAGMQGPQHCPMAGEIAETLVASSELFG